MSFPVPVEYGLNDTKDNTIVKYNNGTEWEGLPSPQPGGGGGGGTLNVNCSVEHGTHGETTYTLDKTWKEINEAFTAGTIVIVSQNDGANLTRDIVTFIGEYTGEEATSYQIGFGSGYNALILVTNSENGYPEYVSI